MFRRILLTTASMALVLAMSPAAATAHHGPHHGPAALLSLDGGSPIKGAVRYGRSSTLEPIPFSGGEDAVMRLTSDKARIIEWKVVYTPYRVGESKLLSRSGPSDGTNYRQIEFTAPRPGDWRVDIYVKYERADGGRGSANFEWRLSSVPPDSATIASPVAAQAAATPLLMALPVLMLALGVSLVLFQRVRRRA